MAGLIEDDTDVEMGRYDEAYQIKTYSGLSPSNMRGASVQYDPVNKTEAVYVDLPSGGKFRIGDRPVTPMQVAETDAAKAAAVPVSEDIDTFAKNYKSNPSNIGGKDPSFDDYDMAGYSQAEILQYEKSRTEQYMAQPNIADVVKLTPDQTSQYAAQPDAEMISDYQPPGMFEGAVSETVKGLARGGLVNPSKFLKENFNLYDPLVFQIVDPKTGEFDPQLKIVSREEKTEIDRAIAAGEMPFALDFEQLVQSDTEAGPGAKMIGGLSQFVGAFAGVGKLFKVGSGLVGAASQGAAADFLGFEGNEGRLTDLLLELGVPENRVTDFLRTDPNDPDYVGRFKNALEGGVLGVIADQIAPVYRMIKEGGSKTELGQAIGDLRSQSRQLFSDRLSDVIGAGRAIAQGDTEMLGEVFQRGRPPQSLSAAAPQDVANLVSKPERAIIKASVPKANLAPVQEQIAGQKASYPATDGWAKGVMQVSKVNVKEFKAPKRKENETDAAYAARVGKARDKHEDKFEVEYKEVPYNFDRAPMGVSPEDWQRTMVSRQVNEVKLLADRVRAGDPAAIAIVNEANWYRAMRSSLRKEFGGMGDVFADVLGATSAQTGVEMNWNNAIEVMRRFSRGEYDEELRMYDEMLKKGKIDPTELQQMHKDPNNPFRLVTNAAGSLFNANSPAATKALFDMFRVATGAPKTPNFTGNLIGYTNAATIDVWAARHLRRLAGLDRLPPPVEKGVVGKHLKGSTLEQPNISGEFGFGQRVLADAADKINKQGIIRSVAPNLQDMNPDDLQAVAWFIEKEKWTKNGWTNKAGEGGSFEFESSLAGAPDPAAVKEARRATTASFKAPNKRVKETEDEYAARVAEARAAHDASVVSAQKQLDEMKAPLARYVLGISVERPGMRPTNVQQADIAARLGEPAKADPSVVTYQINNTYGRFMQSDERAFNAEFVVRRNFNPAGVTRRMVEVAKEADQDAAFISKVMPQRTPESRPGVEIYFRKRQAPDFARRLSDKLTQYGVDGFTFVTDSRVMDRPSAQSGMEGEAVAGINGLRFQYIPEFDMGKDAWAAMSSAEKAAKIDEVEYLFTKIANDIQKTEQGISAANIMHYETNVIERDQYDGLLGTSPTTPNQ